MRETSHETDIASSTIVKYNTLLKIMLFVAQNNGKESKPAGERVSIIGTGNFARALAKRLLQNGFRCAATAISVMQH